MSQQVSPRQYELYGKMARRFLAAMNRIMSWEALCAMIEPYYPKPDNGRPAHRPGIRSPGEIPTINMGLTSGFLNFTLRAFLQIITFVRTKLHFAT